MKKKARWRMVHDKRGWHLRFVAANGRIMVWSESYTRRTSARHALLRLWNLTRDVEAWSRAEGP